MSSTGLAGLRRLVCVVTATAMASHALAQASSCAAAPGSGARQVSQGELNLVWQSVPQPLPLNKPFALNIAVCGASDARLVRVDADMPAHGHGMNYRASLRELSGGRWQAQGLVFHMPGRWRLSFELQHGEQRLRLTDAIELR